jgi:hypothetical protein
VVQKLGPVSEIGARALDCSAIDRNGRGKAEQGAHSVAVVHSFLLSRGRARNVRTALQFGIRVLEPPGKNRIDRNSLRDRNGTFEGNLAPGGRAPVDARNTSLGRCRRRRVRADHGQLDPTVKKAPRKPANFRESPVC